MGGGDGRRGGGGSGQRSNLAEIKPWSQASQSDTRKRRAQASGKTWRQQVALEGEKEPPQPPLRIRSRPLFAASPGQAEAERR